MILPTPFYEGQSMANVPQLESLLHGVMAALMKLFALILGGDSDTSPFHPGE